MRNVFAMIGCATVVVALALGAWIYRDKLRTAYDSYREQRVETAGARAANEGTRGTPSNEARQRAEEKERAIADPRGPAYVVFSADEAASLIVARLAPQVRAAVDSLSVALASDRLTLRGRMRLDVLGRELLGPLMDLLGSTQPLRVAGPLEVREPGVLAWVVDDFVIREFAFPQAAVPRLVHRLTGDTTGAFMLPAPESVVDVRVRADGVVFYRRVP